MENVCEAYGGFAEGRMQEGAVALICNKQQSLFFADFRRLAAKKALASSRNSFSSFKRWISLSCSLSRFLSSMSSSLRDSALLGVCTADKCKTCGESINKSIDEIYSLPVAGNVNNELLELLVNIRKCRFLHMMSYFTHENTRKIPGRINYMPNILLDESRFHKLNGVLMEALVTYDIDNERYGYMLPIAKSIAEFLCKYEGTEECKDIACLNYLQVLRRMGTISKKDLKDARVIIGNPDKPNILRLGALIIVKNYDEAQKVFENLEENQKSQVVGFPIYRLWKKPPCSANIVPPNFNIFE